MTMTQPLRSVMYKVILIPLLFIFFSLVQGADPLEAELGRLDPMEAGRDPELVALTAPKVTEVSEDTPAEMMGLLPGDLIVGLDGLRTIGQGEWDMVRFCYNERPKDIYISVLRNYRVIELRAPSILPGRRAGFHSHLNLNPLRKALRRIGFNVPDQGGIGLSTRSALALLRWHAYREPSADVTWIPILAARITALSAGNWAKAASLPAPQVPPTCPDIQRLAGFYATISAYHAGGEQPPDKNHHGETLAYYVINYPYPQVFLPPLGTVTHPDQRFIQGLENIRQLKADEVLAEEAALHYPPQAGESNYALSVRWAMMDQKYHGAWPYRHQGIRTTESRPIITEELQSHIAAGDALADWSRFSLASAQLMEALESEHKDPVGNTLPLMREVKKTSPLLAYLLVARVVIDACKDWNVNGIRDSLRDFLDDGAVPDTEQPSQLLAYLRQHDASLSFRLIPDEQGLLTDQLYKIYAALMRPTSYVNLRNKIIAPDVAKLPYAQRQELMKQMLDYVRFSCQKIDVELMAKLELPNAFIAAMSEIAYWHALTPNDVSWVFSDKNIVLHPEQELANIARVHAAVIPWSNREETNRAVEELQHFSGTPLAALLLAEKCSTHEREDLASPLRDNIIVLHERFTQLKNIFENQINQDNERSILRAQIIAFAGFSQTANLARNIQDSYALSFDVDNDLDSTPLYSALSFINQPQPDHNMAIAMLCDSFDDSITKDAQPLFMTPEKTITECREFRSWLLAILIKDKDFPMQRLRVIANARANMVDEAFAAMLKVRRESLIGDGQIAPENNND